MASNDEDMQMADASPTSNLMGNSASSRQDYDSRSVIVNESSDSMILNQASLQNGIREPPPTSDTGHMNGTLVAPSSIIDNEARQTSVPANDVPSSLSVEHYTSNFSSTEDEFDDEEMEELDELAPYTSFLPTGYVYDIRMRYHSELDPPQERRELHPEDPRRIFKIYQQLCSAGLIEHETFNRGYLIPNPLRNIPVREATEAEVTLVHDKRHWDFMVSTQSMFFSLLSSVKDAHGFATRNATRGIGHH